MAKEIYLYSGLYNSSAMELMQAITEQMNKECTILENCYGGDVFATMGINAKLKEHGNVTIKVYGAAFSGGFNILMYAKKVVALNTARFLIHRADGYISSPEQQKLLNDMNTDLKAQMLKRVDGSKLLSMKGVSVDQIFDPEQRIDLFLSAQEMKDLKLIDEIEVLSPMEMKAHEETMFRIAANYPAPTTENQNPVVMTTLAELKQQNPALYALAIAEGEKTGAEKEADRINAALVFAHLDLEGVKKIIASGKSMTQTQIAEFSLKASSKTAIEAIVSDNAKITQTGEVPPAIAAVTAEQKELSDFEKGVRADLKLKN